MRCTLRATLIRKVLSVLALGGFGCGDAQPSTAAATEPCDPFVGEYRPLTLGREVLVVARSADERYFVISVTTTFRPGDEELADDEEAGFLFFASEPGERVLIRQDIHNYIVGAMGDSEGYQFWFRLGREDASEDEMYRFVASTTEEDRSASLYAWNDAPVNDLDPNDLLETLMLVGVDEIEDFEIQNLPAGDEIEYMAEAAGDGELLLTRPSHDFLPSRLRFFYRHLEELVWVEYPSLYAARSLGGLTTMIVRAPRGRAHVELRNPAIRVHEGTLDMPGLGTTELQNVQFSPDLEEELRTMDFECLVEPSTPLTWDDCDADPQLADCP